MGLYSITVFIYFMILLVCKPSLLVCAMFGSFRLVFSKAFSSSLAPTILLDDIIALKALKYWEEEKTFAH